MPPDAWGRGEPLGSTMTSRAIIRTKARCAGSVRSRPEGLLGVTRLKRSRQRLAARTAGLKVAAGICYDEGFLSVPVSSRGQDTWFSATGPGFESPYRYHPSLA